MKTHTIEYLSTDKKGKITRTKKFPWGKRFLQVDNAIHAAQQKTSILYSYGSYYWVTNDKTELIEQMAKQGKYHTRIIGRF